MTRKRTRDDAVYQLLDLEATVGDHDEEDQDQEDNEGTSAGIPD
jgi:hypothetical protein